MKVKYLSPGIYRIAGIRVQLFGQATVYGDVVETEADYQADNWARLEDEELRRDAELTRHDRYIPGVA